MAVRAGGLNKPGALMFYITLSVQQRGDDQLILTPRGFFRIGFALICGILLAGLGANLGGKASPAGICFLILSAWGLLYEERWIFDRRRGVVEYRWGLLFLAKKWRCPFEEVKTLTFVTLQGGKEIDPEQEMTRGGARYSLFGLLTKGGERRSIEIIKSRLAPGLLEKAQTVSRFCPLPLAQKNNSG